MMTPQVRDDNIRREALAQALRLFEDRQQPVERIVSAAKAFETYLKGEGE